MQNQQGHSVSDCEDSTMALLVCQEVDMSSILILFPILSVFAFADNGPLVVKSNSPGYALANMARSETCELFKDKIVIQRQYGLGNPDEIKIKQELPLVLDGDIELLIEHAAAENEIRRPNNFCDAPETNMSAFAHKTKVVVLFATGGCGMDHVERIGPASRALRDMVDKYCPEYHEHANQ